MKVSMKVEGLRDLDAALGQLGKRTSKTVMRRALIKAAEPMRDLAATLAPEDTGLLREEIDISAKADGAALGKSEFRDVLRGGGSRGEAAAAMRQARRAAEGSVTLYMGPTIKAAKRGRMQEFGTEHNAPKAFMRPAFDAQAQPTIERLKPILAAEIDKAARRAARKAAKKAG